jgi:hypothetical protein
MNLAKPAMEFRLNLLHRSSGHIVFYYPGGRRMIGIVMRPRMPVGVAGIAMARPRRVHLPVRRRGKEKSRLRGSWAVASMPTLIGGTAR